MTVREVLALLARNKDERGIKVWERTGRKGLETFGIGITRLKALAKTIGRDHALALDLWKEPYLDARLLACMIDEPRAVSEEQVDRQVADAGMWLLSHTYCQMLLSKTPFAVDTAVAWAKSRDDTRRRCAWLLLYHIAKDEKKLGDDFFEPYLDVIEKRLQNEENMVKDGMNSALFRIGMRSRRLNRRAVAVAKKVGRVEVDYGDNSCEAVDALKHLTSPALLKKLR